MKNKIVILFLIISLVITGIIIGHNLLTPSTKAETPIRPQKYLYPEYSEYACKNSSDIGLPADSGILKSHIIYQINQRDDDSASTWVVKLDGSASIPLTGYPKSPYDIGFFQNGQQFLIIGNGDVWLGDIDGSELEAIQDTSEVIANYLPYSSMWQYLRNNESLFSPIEGPGRFVAPDQKKAFSWKEGDQAVSLLDENGQTIKNIINTGAHDYVNGRWTSDSEWFIFILERNSEEENYHQAMMVNGNGNELITLTYKDTDSLWGDLEISPDNKKVAFDYLFSEGTPNYQIGIIWLDEKNPKFITYNLQKNINLESSLSSKTLFWSPDNNWLAFMNIWVEKNEGGVDIHALDINSGEVYCVTKDISGKTLMDWK